MGLRSLFIDSRLLRRRLHRLMARKTGVRGPIPENGQGKIAAQVGHASVQAFWEPV